MNGHDSACIKTRVAGGLIRHKLPESREGPLISLQMLLLTSAFSTLNARQNDV